MTRDRGSLEPTLERTVGLPGAVAFGLGAMVGTGVFVYTGVAAGLAGPAMLASLGIAGLAAAANGLSSAQLAMLFPRAGGTYEYAGRILSPAAGFLAGWVFLAAKSTSAAATALGFGAYVAAVIGLPPLAVSLGLVAAVTVIGLFRLRGAGVLNSVLLAVTVLSLGAFVATGAGRLRPESFTPFAPHGLRGILAAAAVLFVAYAGYARVATLGEEIREPRRNIPRAVVLSLLAAAALYALVSIVAIGAIGAPALAAAAESGAPLQRAAASPAVRLGMSVGAVTALGAVFLNLHLGLSRMVFAMARGSDLPGPLASLNPASIPYAAVVVVGIGVAILTTAGSLVGLVSLSAFAVLVYYGLTNLSALRLGREDRFLPAFVPAAGLVFCLALAASVPRRHLLTGVGVLAAGALWRLGWSRLRRRGG